MARWKRLIISILWALIAFIVVVVVFASFTNDDSSDTFFAVMALSIIAIPIVSGVIVYKRYPQMHMEPSQSEDSEGILPKQSETKSAKQGHMIKAKLQLVGGLMNLPEGSICRAKYNKSQITFSASGQEFSLDAFKMLDASVMTSTEIQKQYVSSVGGAVAGAVLLGPLGAILGGSASKRTVKTKRKYLVFSYLSNEETKYIVFDVTTIPAVGNRIASTYRYLKKNGKVKVEL